MTRGALSSAFDHENFNYDIIELSPNIQMNTNGVKLWHFIDGTAEKCLSETFRICIIFFPAGETHEVAVV